MAEHKKNCKICGEIFASFRTTDRYCSLTCSKKAMNENVVRRTKKYEERNVDTFKNKYGKKTGKMKMKCKQCRQIYERYSSNVKFRGSNFCDNKCKNKYKRENKTIGQIKADVWDWFSKYIRLRNADKDGTAKCVTCGVRMEWKKLHAGHFVPKARGSSVYFVEDNVHCQCMRCNINLGSNPSAYALFIIKTYGVDKIAELEALAGTEIHFTKDQLKNMEEVYKQKTADLLSSLND